MVSRRLPSSNGRNLLLPLVCPWPYRLLPIVLPRQERCSDRSVPPLGKTADLNAYLPCRGNNADPGRGKDGWCLLRIARLRARRRWSPPRCIRRGRATGWWIEESAPAAASSTTNARGNAVNDFGCTSCE